MKIVPLQIRDAFITARKKDYDHIVVAIDLHDTIIDSEVFNELQLDGESLEDAITESIYANAVKPLQHMSLRKDIQLMLFSGTRVFILQQVVDILHKKYGIQFVHINTYISEDPVPRQVQSFKEKPYYSIIWDDKGGFVPLDDWDSVKSGIEMYSII